MSRLEEMADVHEQTVRAESMLERTGTVLARMGPEHFRAVGHSACREILTLQKRVLDLIPAHVEQAPDAIAGMRQALVEALSHLERLLPLLELAGNARDVRARTGPRSRVSRRRPARRRSRAARASATRAGPGDDPPPPRSKSRARRAKRSP